MTILSKSASRFLKHPMGFALRVLNGFSKNQGMLLAGAIAYYALLSLIPFLILSAMILSHWVNPQELLKTMGHYLDWLVPSQSQALLADVSDFLNNQIKIGVVLILTMLFFSSLSFSVLEKALVVIFAHHEIIRKRHFLMSAILPYYFVVFLCLALMGVTIGSVAIQSMDQSSIHIFNHDWSLHGLSGKLLYALELFVKILILTSLYLVLPKDKIRLQHALIGGFTAALLWEVIHYILIWYFTTLSKTSVVYGSLTTAVVALFSMEIAAALLLLGAQVISEYEQLGRE